MTYFVVTHIPIPWNIPFDHVEVGVEGYIPQNEKSTSTATTLSRNIDMETAFGAMRALMPMNNYLTNEPDDTDVFMGSYRLFLGKETTEDWLNPKLQENTIISPEELKNNWDRHIITKIPEGVDILIGAPRLLPDTLIGQYSRVHHLDDLLLALGCAIRHGLVNPISAPAILQSNTLVPYSNFASKKKFRMDFNQRVWECAHEFYMKHYVPRIGYQRRVIDFAFERISALAVINLIVNKNLNCLACRNVWVSETGSYQQTN